MLVSLQLKGLHNDIGCSYEANSFGRALPLVQLHRLGHVERADERACWAAPPASSYDGNPGGSKERPDWGVLWRFAAETGVTYFGAGAAFFANCMKAGLARWPTMRRPHPHPRAGHHGLSAGARGAAMGHGAVSRPSAMAGGEPQPDIWWNNISGGTDFCGAFIGGHRELPLVPGEMQCRMLGAAVQAWDEQGQPVVDAVGELVCTQPIPSMPLYLWGDKDGSRYLSSYFDMYPPGHGRQPGGGDGPPAVGAVWRHGDWLRIGAHGGCTIYGRSDATINRHGLRMGTSEIYSAVEALPEVLDSLVVDLEYLGRESYMPLFVVLREGCTLDDALRARIHAAIRTALSPRFVPDAIFAVAEVPRTLSGKKQELPIKKLLLGQPLEKVVNRDAMANPGCLDWYVAFAAQRAQAA
jgi:acetoacetyl-CoA synthetase